MISMKKALLYILLVLSAMPYSKAQSRAVDKYYQDRIESAISLGKDLAARGDSLAAIEYFVDAIKIAEKRSHDWYASFQICDSYILDDVIPYYYKLDSLTTARHYVDDYAVFHDRFEHQLMDEGTITEPEYWGYIETFYSRAIDKVSAAGDTEYALKYHELYHKICIDHSVVNDRVLLFETLLAYQYASDKEYLKAIDMVNTLYNLSRSLGADIADAVTAPALAYHEALYTSSDKNKFGSYTDVSLAKAANEKWLSFLEKVYGDMGPSKADSLWLEVDRLPNLSKGLETWNMSSTMMSALLARSMISVSGEGYDEAIENLDDVKSYLYSRDMAPLWIGCFFSFINVLETREEYTTSYRLCRRYEPDFAESSTTVSYDDHVEFYMHYFSACMKNGDISGAFEICSNELEQVDEGSDHYYLTRGILGEFYKNIGQREKNLQYRKESVDAFYRSRFTNDPIREEGVVTALGDAYMRLGQYDQARECFDKALAIYENNPSVVSPFFAYFRLGELYEKEKDYAKAKEYFLKCVDIQTQKATGYYESAPLSFLFHLENQLGNVKSARTYLEDMWRSSLEQFMANRDYLSVNEQLLYWSNYGNIGYIGGLVANSGSEYTDIYYDMLLASKGFLLRSEQEIEKNVLSSGDVELISLYNIARNNAFSVQDDTDAFMTRYRGHSFPSAVENFSFSKVADALKKGEVAMEVFEYALDDGFRYGALLLRHGDKRPQFIDICDQKELDAAVAKGPRVYRSTVLYDIIWKPLEGKLKKGERVYFSPHQTFHTINLSAVTNPHGDTFGNVYNVCRVSSTSQVCERTNVPAASARLYGGLVYDTTEEDMIKEHLKYGDSGLNRGWQVDTTFRSGWEYLPNTASEASEIASLLNAKRYDVETFDGVSGTEESFKAMDKKSPGILHLATHGFYVKYSYSAPEESRGRIGEISSSQSMMRSGLIMSNGARAWRGDPIPVGVDDGILQADEISRVDLSNTSLLVLSACQTALGDVMNDGVYGLQRAFKISGVETIIMSLWEVNDKATSQFMAEFYKTWLSGKTKQEAFKEAQRSLREQYQDPYYWAAFIMLD